MIRDIGKITKYGEFDYNTLVNALSHYKAPRKAINSLLKKRAIIRVKKGLYVFGDLEGAPKYSLEILANLIYGPSYISREYALSYYNLIPERVVVITSTSAKRSKVFESPVGTFDYKYLNIKKYSVGITQVRASENRVVLMAGPEKAIVDMLEQHKDIKGKRQIKEFLIESVRISSELSERLSIQKLEAIQSVFKSGSIDYLIKLLKGNEL